MKYPLSLVVITLNEEKDIARCIQSVPFAQEIIVVDSLSQDATPTIAEELGAKVISKKFEGYRSQKQFAIDQATYPWVISLDADEALSPRLQQEIQALWERGPKRGGYKMPRCSFHLGRWIRHGGWYPDYQVRFFKKDQASWVGGHIHERVEVKGGVGALKGEILHYVFDDLNEQINTNNDFSRLGADDLWNKKEKFSILKLCFRPAGKFLECYIWKRGFLDGVPGFIIALGAAQSLFLKYAKLWEREFEAF